MALMLFVSIWQYPHPLSKLVNTDYAYALRHRRHLAPHPQRFYAD